jgi:hypothetical protein
MLNVRASSVGKSPAQPASSDRPLSVEIGAGRLAAESYK